MIRSEVVRPDSILTDLEGREIPVVSREAMIDAAIRAGDVLLLAGGEFTMSSQRVPSGFANESVSAVGFVTWRSGTARTSRPQPEEHVAVPDFERVTGTGDDGAIVVPDEDDEADLDEADVEDHVPTAAH